MSVDAGNYYILAVSRCLDRFVDLAVCIALCLSLALVVILLTSAQAELDFASAVLIEIYRQRDQRQALLGLNCSVQFVDFLSVHQKSAHSKRINIVSVALLIRRYVHARHDQFALACDLGIALLDADAALADRFDLGARQHDACLVTLLDEIVMEGFLVIRYYFS